MMWIRPALIALAFVFVCASGCSPESPSDPTTSSDAQASSQSTRSPESEREKTLYALGAMVSRPLIRFSLSESEWAWVRQGAEDGLLGRELAANPDDYQDQMQALYEARTQPPPEVVAAAGDYLVEQAAADGAVKHESGLIMTEIVAGEGASPAPTDTVVVHYHGTLTDGTVFDSSVDRGEKARFPLNRVIPCWTEALGRMKVGGKSRLVCPPQIAYGSRGSGKIPPNAPIVFEVELFEIAN